MNYRPMFEFASGERLGNAQVCATREEAQGSAEDRFSVWTMPTGCGVDETADPVTYRWDSDEGDVRLPLEAEEA
jgi:hypothetical protein